MIRRERTFPRYVNQRNFTLAVAAAILAAIGGFFAYEFKFLRSPNLEVAAPAHDLATLERSIDIRGQTDPEADVTLNGRPLYSGETGEFSERLHLVNGVNRLEFVSRSPAGRATAVTRYVVAR
ncbi:MAG: hypothetical protein A3B37_00680 [Candidatus Sungbacteria bacterium RIFCSPLOWO2_01_FULL_59_16]|uniref:Uncharacterized protein n=1 Tax=Candidatus Sungbacteria bacterium RIFCSPLOWO2_01_FULL_59_16 TaxID=1802280 RepID=A0A1G2LDG4_9BACT|nr:MAG: hypothetical protein A3B37_00680 [Candidatus Sungbacteria bacterium RIFCSPLOWO2_01_FULL_59_16]